VGAARWVFVSIMAVAFVDVGWWILLGIVGASVLGLLLYFRRLRRWRQPPPMSPEAKLAEARLWSTRLNEQR
jgi:hypothetical protein